MKKKNVKERLPISVIILTYNEGKNIEKCLESVYEWVDEIFIVDSGSIDKTLEITKTYTDKIYYHSFETHSKQWAWALNNLPIKNQWVLGLDADQVITPELADEMSRIFINKEIDKYHGYYIKRRQIFLGKWIRHGGYYPYYLLKLFKKDCVKIEEKELIDHHFYVNGNTGKFKNDLIEWNRKEDDLSFWIDKHNRYATLQAIEEIYLRDKPDDKSSLFGNKDQRTLWLKNKIWRRLPLFIRSFLYFIYRYFFRLGFLDGVEGLIFHLLQGFWYRFMVDVRIWEMKRSKSAE